jgi:hypothetical protein
MRPTPKTGTRAVLLAALTALAALVAPCRAQDLEPRAYSASPVGLNFAALVYVRSTGDIVFDPSIPITNASAHINALALGYGRTFSLFGRQALVTAALPYAWGDAEGDVGDVHRRVERSGLADLKARISVNLAGNPAVSRDEFARQSHDRVLIAASLTLSAPTGQYDETKLINLGTNRWAFKPEVGIAVPWKGFDFDLYAGVILFTRNPNFYPGDSTRDQDPLATVQTHVSYTFRPGLWLALDGTWYGGGSVHVNGGPATARLSNTRTGGTLSVPLSRSQSFKFAYSRGAFVRVGQDFDTFSVGWQIRWF